MNTTTQKNQEETVKLAINTSVKYAESKIQNWQLPENISNLLYEEQTFKDTIISLLSAENMLTDENAHLYIQNLRDHSINTKEVHELFKTSFNEKWNHCEKKAYIIGFQIQLSLYIFFSILNDEILCAIEDPTRIPGFHPPLTQKNPEYIKNFWVKLIPVLLQGRIFEKTILAQLHYPVASRIIPEITSHYIFTLEGGDDFHEIIEEDKEQDSLTAAIKRESQHIKTGEASNTLTPQDLENIEQLKALSIQLTQNHPFLTAVEKNPGALSKVLNKPSLDAFLKEANYPSSNLKSCIAKFVTDATQKLVDLSSAERLTRLPEPNNSNLPHATHNSLRPS